MATEKPRFSVSFSEDSFEKIKKYQEEHNITTQSKAVSQLVELAINKIEGLDNIENNVIREEELPTREEQVGSTRKWLEDLMIEKGYIKRGEDISETQAKFLIHLVGLLDAWFDTQTKD